MILRCLLLVAGSINVFALVPQCPPSTSTRRSLQWSHRTTASARTYTTFTLPYPRRLPRTSTLLPESSDSTQDISENYLLDSPQEGDGDHTVSQSQSSSQSPPQQQQQQQPPPVPVPVPVTPFARNEQWLEDATDDILDEQLYPLASLAEDDLESINALMVAWARRRCTVGALTVERLLKRVVDDMHAGNDRVHVNTRMYTHVS
jgi:hypothetical protein